MPDDLSQEDRNRGNRADNGRLFGAVGVPVGNRTDNNMGLAIAHSKHVRTDRRADPATNAQVRIHARPEKRLNRSAATARAAAGRAARWRGRSCRRRRLPGLATRRRDVRGAAVDILAPGDQQMQETGRADQINSQKYSFHTPDILQRGSTPPQARRGRWASLVSDPRDSPWAVMLEAVSATGGSAGAEASRIERTPTGFPIIARRESPG
jgi:hypothetical protein